MLLHELKEVLPISLGHGDIDNSNPARSMERAWVDERLEEGSLRVLETIDAMGIAPNFFVELKGETTLGWRLRLAWWFLFSWFLGARRVKRTEVGLVD